MIKYFRDPFSILLCIFLYLGISSLFLYKPSPERFVLITVSLGAVLLCAKVKMLLREIENLKKNN